MFEQPEVVVVGAGPVGLWVASELALQGVSVMVVERNETRSPHSKALGIHPRTVETLALRATEKAFLEHGKPIPNWHFAMLPTRLDFTALDTPYPFMLAYPQARTEEHLERRARTLGVQIRTGTPVTGLEQSRTGVKVEGEDFEIETSWVVGCDGAGSVVRRAAGIDFIGTDGGDPQIMGELVLDDPPPGAGFMTHTRAGAIIVIPLPGGRHRVSTPRAAGRENDEPTVDELKAMTKRITGSDYGMHDADWLTTFDSPARLAARYRQGRVLLAGDAAHMHYPAGGVGLNVGLQDAMNLGWKLAAVVQGRAGVGLLDTYHAERHAVGEDLMRHVLTQTELIVTRSLQGIATRQLFDEQLRTVKEFNHSLAMKISGLEVAYPSDHKTHELLGRRMPGPAGEQLFHLFRAGRPVLLTSMSTRLNTATRHAGALGISTARSTLLGSDRDHWRTAGAALIRPDGYVWWAGDSTSPTLEGDLISALTQLPARF